MLLCSAGSGCSVTVWSTTPSVASTALPSLYQVKAGAGSPFTLIWGRGEDWGFVETWKQVKRFILTILLPEAPLSILQIDN